MLARHARSLLLDCDGERRDYVWLLAPGLDLAPRACTCPPAALAIEPGARVRWIGSHLELGCHVELELAGAEPWDPLWRPNLGVKGNVRRELGSPTQTMSPQVQQLVEELAATDIERASLAGLLGLGTGSTPEGDDLLVGLRAAWQLRQHLGDDSTLAIVDQLIDEIREAQTHPLSLRALRDARMGYYPEALARCLDALHGQGQLGPALDALSGTGGSSGPAFCWGLWLGWTLPTR